MNSLDLTLSTAINAGRITGTGIKLDGRPVDMPGQPANAPPVVFGPDGWSEHETVIGGRRSKGVDALTIALIQANYLDVADRLPAFHVFADRVGSEVVTNIGAMSKPIAALDPEQAEPGTGRLRQENVRAVMNSLWAQGLGNDIEILNKDYRGGATGSVPRATIGGRGGQADVTWTAATGSPESNVLYLDTMFKAPAIRTAAAKYPNVDKPQLLANDIEATAPFADHMVYDLLFNTTTDTAVTRYWASWIASIGITLPKSK